MSQAQAIKSIRDLKVYQAAYQLAVDVFHITKTFPKAETYSLVDQLRRSSRSVASNIREGYGKRRYEQLFIRHLNDALGSSEETRTWLEFSRDANYIAREQYDAIEHRYDEVSAMLYTLMENWQKFEDGPGIWPLSSDI